MLHESIDRSLLRLGTDRVDLVQFHLCDEARLGQGDVIAVLQEARDACKTRLIDYSGDCEAARYAIKCGAFDTLQTSVSIADQQPATLTLPSALEKGMGVIAKRPIANAAWTKEKMPESEYAYPYFNPYFKRLQSLAYDFLHGPASRGDGIVETRNPARWIANARRLGDGPLPPAQAEAIRTRWQEVVGPDWFGQD